MKVALVLTALLCSTLPSAAKCTYALSPTSASVASGGGSGGSITMTASSGCGWTAATTNAWIHTSSSGAGNGTINYTVDANPSQLPRTGSITAGGLTAVITQAGTPISLGVAVDNTNLVWVTDSVYPWFGTNPPAPSFDGKYSAVSGNRLVPSSSSWLQTTLIGPGTLSFWWRVDSDVTPPPPATPYSYDELEVDINGVMQDQIMGQIDWNYRVYSIPPGTNIVTWQYVKDATYNAGMDQGWLDQIHYTTNAPIPLSQALDTCGVNWTSGGNTNPTVWAGETNVTHDGQSAAQSGAVYTSQESWLQTSVSGITNLSFWWKVSSQTNYDYLEFYTNSILATRISGEVDWRSNFFRLPTSTNQLKWRFVRTNVVLIAQGQSCGWLDRVSLSPSPKPQVLAYATNVVLSTTATNCQAILPDLTGPAYLTLADNCTSVGVTQSPPAGTALGVGASHAVLTVSDASGDTIKVTNNVVVVDTTPPVLSLLGPNPLTNECHAAFIDPGATASDNCSGVLTLGTNSSVNPNAVGAYTIQYIATDASGNAVTNSRSVYIVDTRPPVITLNGADPLVLECHGSFTDPGATASDECAGPVSVSASGTVNPNVPGNYSLTYTAVDPSGNLATRSRTVQVVDTRPPVITLNGADPLVLECHSSFTDPGATASDDCAGSVSVSVSGTVNPNAPGNYSLTYTAVDPSGNLATRSRNVQVVDTTPPRITQVVPPQTLAAGSNCTVALPDLTLLLGATDNCSPVLNRIQIPAPGTTLALGSSTNVIFLVDDGNGNTNTSSTLVGVTDQTPPLITSQPLCQTNCTGGQAVFTVAATSCSTLAYQWYSGNHQIPNQTNATLTLSRITSADAGTYNVLVTSPAGTVPSLSAQLVVTNVVLTPPTMLSSHLLNDGSFRISFSGPEGQTYRVLATSDLTLPMTSWTVLTNGAFTAEPIQVIDPAASLPQRFYRIASP